MKLKSSHITSEFFKIESVSGKFCIYRRRKRIDIDSDCQSSRVFRSTSEVESLLGEYAGSIELYAPNDEQFKVTMVYK